jgi:hypothetical protein
MNSLRPALFVAHPGHELRLYRWLETAQPDVYVLTDGSGSAGHSRVGSTRRVLEATGARPGSILGVFSDLEIYDAIMRSDIADVVDMTLRLAEAFTAAEIVVVDAWEGYNPAHDLCRIIGELATARAALLSGRSIPLYESAVVGSWSVDNTPGERVVRLDDAALQRKLDAAFAYPELRAEVDEMVRAGESALRLEVIRPAEAPVPEPHPYYEVRGEQQVAAGRYQTTLRYEEHFAPFVSALEEALSSVPATLDSFHQRPGAGAVSLARS